MTPTVVAAALFAAITAACVVRLLLYTPRRLEPRLRPHLLVVRSRLGTARPVTIADVPAGRSGLVEVFGPMVARGADLLARLLDASGPAATALRLRQAGRTMTVDAYRSRQLAFTVGGTAGGVLIGVALGASSVIVLVLAAAGAWWGASWMRAQVDRAIRLRREAIRADLYTVCQLLAVYLRTGSTPIGALQRLIDRVCSPVAAELDNAVQRVRAGTPPEIALADLAGSTPEPVAARLYRLIGASWTAGGDPTALLALAEDLQNLRRDDLTRTMGRRRIAMIVPLVAVMAPVMILFIVAALPRLIFGS